MFAVARTASGWAVVEMADARGAPIAEFQAGPDGWAAAVAACRDMDGEVSPPFWRRRGPGWVIVNGAIGLAAGIVMSFILVAVLVATGADASRGSTNEPAGNALIILLWLAGMVGWWLFAYLPVPARTRAIVLASVYGGAFLLSVIALMTVVVTDI
jgi:hypothetical protein